MPPNIKHLPPLLDLAKHQDDEEPQVEQEWDCPASSKSLRTTNPIRAIVDPIVAAGAAKRKDGKKFISLALGDPTAAANKDLVPCPVAIDAIVQAVQAPGHSAGYVNACGTVECRQAIANFHSSISNGVIKVDYNDIIVANGCSGALELALTALLDNNEDSILLVPNPGFPLYQVIAESHGASVLPYNLVAEQGWQCDLQHLQELLQAHAKQSQRKSIRGLVLTNPSNPTGSVYSRQHLRDICQLAKQYRIPIVADEVYGDLVFGSNQFHPMAEIAAQYEVPVICASGIGKQFLLPGWRLGWLVFHDNPQQALAKVEAGAKRLAQVILGASHLVQSIVPTLLDPSDAADRLVLQEWKQGLRTALEQQAMTLHRALQQSCPGLCVSSLQPQGAMYALVGIDFDAFDEEIQTDVDFTKLLMQEEAVLVLPGRAFGLGGVFRVVFCASTEVLEEAAGRISAFCMRHAIK